MPGTNAIDIFLQPGDFEFGDALYRFRTLLGSCVAITMWHPRLRIGGMCHYMLPRRGRERDGDLDGRYANEAIGLFLRHIKEAGRPVHEYEVKLFGGGNMFPRQGGRTLTVADRNVRTGLALLAGLGLSATAEDLGGEGHRQIIFEVATGHVWVRHSARPLVRLPGRG